MLKSNKGITLVALIMTIILMTILAGILISTSSKEGARAIVKAQNMTNNVNMIWNEYEPKISNIYSQMEDLLNSFGKDS